MEGPRTSCPRQRVAATTDASAATPRNRARPGPEKENLMDRGILSCGKPAAAWGSAMFAAGRPACLWPGPGGGVLRSFEIYGFARGRLHHGHRRPSRPGLGRCVSRLEDLHRRCLRQRRPIEPERQAKQVRRPGHDADGGVSPPLTFKFEFDLYGTGDDAGQTTFHLPQAYGEWGSLLAGKAAACSWTAACSRTRSISGARRAWCSFATCRSAGRRRAMTCTSRSRWNGRATTSIPATCG